MESLGTTRCARCESHTQAVRVAWRRLSRRTDQFDHARMRYEQAREDYHAARRAGPARFCEARIAGAPCPHHAELGSPVCADHHR